ncbi:MAG: calcium-binding protein [Thauera sp.]|nr:calcium-binding protein [Thauera sp.]
MSTFNNVNDTRAVIDTGFTYADYASEMSDVFSALYRTTGTISSSAPIAVSSGPTRIDATWADGTMLSADIASMRGNSVTVNHIAIEATDVWAEGYGSLKISANTGAFSTASLSRVGFGNDQVAEVWTGKLTVDPNSGAVSGKINTMTLAWSIDDPATAAFEWQYVLLRGNAGLTSSGALTGKVTGMEWGTATSASLHDADLSYAVAGSMGGLKFDANSLFTAIERDGFSALAAGLYSGNDVINGTSADDYLDASLGNDKVYGNGGDDEIYGGLGNDQLFGGAGDDFISGGAGNDKIVDTEGNNTIVDLEGNAQVTTGSGNDFIETGAGNDKIVTGGGADFIDGGAGRDDIRAGDGDDVLAGGVGADKLFGGAGSDRFVFDNLATGGFDTIMDFDSTDAFLLDAGVFTSLAGGVTEENFVVGRAAVEADDFLVFDPRGGKLYYDADGSGAGGAVQIAVIKVGIADLSYDDFGVIV